MATYQFIYVVYFCIVFICSCIFILLSRESDYSAIQARLGVAGHPSTTPRRGNRIKCITQRHNNYTCRFVLHTLPLMQSVKQEAANTNFKVIGLTRPRIKPESTASDADAFTARPCELVYHSSRMQTDAVASQTTKNLKTAVKTLNACSSQWLCWK